MIPVKPMMARAAHAARGRDQGGDQPEIRQAGNKASQPSAGGAAAADAGDAAAAARTTKGAVAPRKPPVSPRASRCEKRQCRHADPGASGAKRVGKAIAAGGSAAAAIAGEVTAAAGKQKWAMVP